MKLHLDKGLGEFRVTGYAAGAIAVNQVAYNGSLIVQVDQAPIAWEAVEGHDINASALAVLLPLEPEVLLIGTGHRQRFPDVEQLHMLYAANVGFEIMDTGAACRTFNILAAEGRRVIAALIPRDA